MAITSTTLGFPQKIEEEIAPYLLPETHPAHKVLTELALESFKHPYLIGEKGFVYFAHGSTAVALTHEKLPGLIIKIPFHKPNDRSLIKRTQGHFHANKFLKEMNVNDFVVSHNWLFVKKTSKEDVELYENFIKSKKELKQEGKFSYVDRKQKAYAIFTNSLLIVEERLDLIEDKEKEKTLDGHFDRKMIDVMEAFFLDVGEDDLNKSNVGLTRTGEIALYDIAYWSKRSEKRLQNGIFGFSRMYQYIPNELKEYWGQKLISLLKDRANERALFHVLSYQNDKGSLVSYVKIDEVETLKKRAKNDLDNSIINRFESKVTEFNKPKEQTHEVVPQTPSFSDKLLSIFRRLNW